MDRYPLRVEAHRDEPLSRWLWLVKWLLLVPHYLALLVLWTGLVVLTLVAYLAVLITGRYPASIRSYNLGVLRWTWRVGYYGYQALGTDAYPPFTLADVPDYPARLSLAPAEPVPRWLPLVAWLFAVPHLIILGALNGAVDWTAGNDGTVTSGSMSVIAALVLTAAVALLFTGHHLRGLYDLLIGVARWNLRVAAYLCLLTPRYPPLRLDQGESEPDGPPDPPAALAPPGRSRPRSATGSVVALVAGVLLLAPATAAGIGGGTLLALDARRDSTGYVTTPDVRLETATSAITAEHVTITDTDVWSRRLGNIGDLRVTATSPTGGAVFAGIAPQSAVGAWLAGTAHDELIGMEPDQARYDRAPGILRPAAEPAVQDFWLVQDSGSGSVTLPWETRDGEYAVVIANPDGSPGVTADVNGAIRVPALAGLGAGLLITGLLLLFAAIALIVLGGTGLGHRHFGEPPSAGPPGPPAPVVSTPPVAASS
ncbi:DUF4389 domain-containing protein [Actinoplanes sp. NEAU-A12]|uniref:DUF4389 domain-containing protein n=1 Tax=Actinoplanes sandaracinus TaxID=3045177 RepID=A0ABT6X1M5_9ACTN|nr:DUF4389 domain-containing protein [Actinoplanes sandaracinus]MDI6105873.1 DUF4389 domain-containing protein [Actinoplanes sandaracinus]